MDSSPDIRDKRASPSLNDRVLALATGKTQQEIATACKGSRPNHVGAAISRHKLSGRIVERQGKLYARPSTGTRQRGALEWAIGIDSNRRAAVRAKWLY